MTRSQDDVDKTLRKLTQEGIRRYVHRQVDSVFDEEGRRRSQYVGLLGRVCLLDKKPLFWHAIWRSGGRRGSKELMALAAKVGITSKATVYRYLEEFQRLNLVKKLPDGTYIAIAPKWLKPR